MTIELHKVTVRELVEGYVDDAETGVRGYGGRLDIRPSGTEVEGRPDRTKKRRGPRSWGPFFLIM